MKKNKNKNIGVALAIVCLLFVAGAYVGRDFFFKTQSEPVVEKDTVAVVTPVLKFGIPVDGYVEKKGVVKPNQNLSFILSEVGLSPENIHQLNMNTEGVFDVRKIRSGQGYSLFTTPDTLNTPAYLVYEEDAKNYVVFQLIAPYKVTRGERPVSWKRQQVKGQVRSSLWMAMEECKTSPLLAIELSNIFGWSIDFFGLQEKDEFRVIYEQEFVENRPLNSFHILAASFLASDSLFYAIPFVQEGEELYYNEKGQSLEGAFLKAPLDFYRISSRFSNSRFHPVLKRYRAHHGVDYAAPTGTPVYAIGNGKVIVKSYQAGGAGNYVKIKHNGSYVTTYMHLSRFAKGLKVGSVVKQKEVIGYVGATGIATGPHLDFRVYENGKPINPLTVKSQPKKPISKDNWPKYQMVRDSLVKQLDSF